MYFQIDCLKCFWDRAQCEVRVRELISGVKHLLIPVVLALKKHNHHPEGSHWNRLLCGWWKSLMILPASFFHHLMLIFCGVWSGWRLSVWINQERIQRASVTMKQSVPMIFIQALKAKLWLFILMQHWHANSDDLSAVVCWHSVVFSQLWCACHW